MRMRRFEFRLPLHATMTNCEPGRKMAYDEDLRWRIVWQREAMGKKCKNDASNLGVDAVTISQKLDLC